MTVHRSVWQATAGVAVAVAAGLLAAFTHHNVPLLVDPAVCAAAPELLATAVARLRPAAAPFAILMPLDTWMFALGTTLVVWLVWRITARALIVCIVGLAVAVSPEVPAYLRPFSSAAVPLAAAWCGLWLPGVYHGGPGRRLAASWALLATTASIWPAALLPALALWLVVAWPASRTGRQSGVAAGAALALLLVTAGVVRGVPSPAPLTCLLPFTETGTAWTAARRLLGVALTPGPYVLALAALGLFSQVDRRNGRAYAVAAAPVFIMAAAAHADFTSPLLVAIWLAAAHGLVAILRACRPGLGGRTAAALLLLLVPVLQWQAGATGRGAVPGDDGHSRLSLLGMTRLLETLPPGAALVAEDASVDVLLRAVWASRPTLRPSAVPADATAVTTRLASGARVFGLPRAQAMLQNLGVRVEDAGPSGLAELFAGGECRALGPDWRVVLDVVRHAPVLALTARDAAEAGPIVLYASFASPPALDPMGWPLPARRGFYTTVYDQTLGEERDHLDRDIADDRLPLDRFARTDRYVARLELWRIPSAPLRLTVGLGQTPTQLIGHVIASRDPRRLTLCPAFPHNVKGLNP